MNQLRKPTQRHRASFLTQSPGRQGHRGSENARTGQSTQLGCESGQTRCQSSCSRPVPVSHLLLPDLVSAAGWFPFPLPPHLPPTPFLPSFSFPSLLPPPSSTPFTCPCPPCPSARVERLGEEVAGSSLPHKSRLAAPQDRKLLEPQPHVATIEPLGHIHWLWGFPRGKYQSSEP